VNHHREGSGPALVLIHGVGHHWQAWTPVIAQLAERFDVIACDSPGFGASPPLPAGVAPTVGAYTDAFAAFLTKLGFERPHVAGNSMGGAIALELARRGLVASAAAFSPAGFWTDAERHFCQASLGVLATTPRPARPPLRGLARTRPGRALLFAQLIARPSRLAPDDAVAALDAAWAAPAFGPALRAFDGYRFAGGDELRGAPVTIAWGDRDRLLLHGRQAPRARRALPWARHVTLGAGHLPFTDDPAAVAEVVRSTAAASSPTNG
jgi:pimeloyl-ACP methyl ester carboxylesterase